MLKTLSLLTTSILLISSASAFAADSDIGQFLYQYKAGTVYRVIANNKTMSWECIKGSELGTKGMETPQRFKLNKHVYYATLVEKTGVQVSQALDFKGMKVYSTITDNKDRYVLEGTIVREKY